MNIKTFLLLICVFTVLPGQTIAQSFLFLDPVTESPKYYKLVSEDGPVRVIEMLLPPGARDQRHDHYNTAEFFLSGGKMKITVDKNEKKAAVPAGHVVFHDPWTHRIENTSRRLIHSIIFEWQEPVFVDDLPGYIDAVHASPGIYKLIGERRGIRVLYMRLEPGQQDNRHSHYYESTYFITGGRARVTVGDETVEADFPDGHVMHHDPWTHQVQNVGRSTIEAVIFELMPTE